MDLYKTPDGMLTEYLSETMKCSFSLKCFVEFGLLLKTGLSLDTPVAWTSSLAPMNC